MTPGSRRVHFSANPGGQFAFVSDFQTPEAGIAGGMGSGKSEGLAFVHTAAACVNRGPSIWISETSGQFSENSLPSLQKQADLLDLGLEQRTVRGNQVLVLEGLPMRDEWAPNWRNVSGGNSVILVRYGVAGARVAGTNATHGSADELARYPMFPGAQSKRDAWINLGFRVRLTPEDPGEEFYPLIRGGGTHEGKATHLYRDFFGAGPNPLLRCPKCADTHLLVVAGHTPKQQAAGFTTWIHRCKVCHWQQVGSRGYTASALDNPHLQPGYLDRVVARISPELIKPYILGLCVDIGTGRTAWAFSERNVVKGLRYSPAQPVYLCCDFNNSPMCWSLWQPCQGCDAHRERGAAGGGWHALEELMDPVHASTADMIGRTIAVLRRWGHRGTVVVYGDTSGDNEDTRSKTTDYELIYDALDDAGFEWDSCVPSGNNPPIMNSVTLYNTQLHSMARNPITGQIESGGHKILIEPDGCPTLVADHEQSTLRNRSGDNGGGWTINKQAYDPHAMDGGRYMIWVAAQADGDVAEVGEGSRRPITAPAETDTRERPDNDAEDELEEEREAWGDDDSPFMDIDFGDPFE